jgi:asparagine synthase (glutamine-hydrolysing)
MCGIAGFYCKKDHFSENDLVKMTNRLAHRGPDASGFYYNQTIGMGHRRLSILDLSERANQPMHSFNNRYVIVYNGEVYNFKSIAASIQIKNTDGLPVKFKTSSDTEIILELFVLHGREFVHQLNGMFAIAIYDKLSNELHLFRDRIGIKPLFYYWDENNFAFASEIKSLLELKQIDRSINRNAIVEFLNLGMITAPSSIYKNIYKMEPGSYINISASGLHSYKYWTPATKINESSFKDEKQELVIISDLLTSSVQYQLLSDVPIGIFLSGGIDSSLITALATQQSGTKVKTFSIGFEENRFNESPYAKSVANFLKTDHYEFTVSYKEAINQIELLDEIYDEPFADSSAIPTLLISKLAKNHVSVTLSGEGGDELFLGYGFYKWAKRLNNPGINFASPLIQKILSYSSNSRLQRVSTMFEKKEYKYVNSHIVSQEQNYFNTTEIESLISPEFKNAYHTYLGDLLSMNLIHKNNNGRKLDPMERQVLFDLSYYLPDDLLTKVDRASMNYSLETRVPYLDHRIIEQAINISTSLKLRNKTSKYILKQILYQYIPQSLFNRPKQGFSIPLAQWLSAEMKYLIDEYLNPESLARTNVFNAGYTKILVQRFLSGEEYLYNRIWLMIVLQKWMRKNNIRF